MSEDRAPRTAAPTASDGNGGAPAGDGKPAHDGGSSRHPRPKAAPDLRSFSSLSQGQAPRVVVIGGGFGGLTVARELGKARLEVVLVDRNNYHLFQPLLYQVATAGLSPADIAYPIRSALRARPDTHVLLGEVESADFDARRVHLSDGTSVAYDYLVIAAGAANNYFGHERDWAPNVLTLKGIDDALEIRRRVLLAFEAAEREADPAARRRLLTFAVIGGGPTGVEVAGALTELSRFVLANDFQMIRPEHARVVLVEMKGRVLPSGFDERLSASAKRQLERLGVEVRLGEPVEAIDTRGVTVGGELIEAATVLWTAGVKAADLARSVGVELDRAGRIPVEPDCSLPGRPEVFAIGDIAAFATADGETLPGLAPVALQQGRHVARTIRRAIDGKPRERFTYFDKGVMATIGRSRAVAQTGGGKLRFGGFLAWIAWLFIHVWFLIGFRNRVSVLLNWAWNYITYRRGARLITGEHAFAELPRLAAKAEHASSPAPPPPDGGRQPALHP